LPGKNIGAFKLCSLIFILASSSFKKQSSQALTDIDIMDTNATQSPKSPTQKIADQDQPQGRNQNPNQSSLQINTRSKPDPKARKFSLNPFSSQRRKSSPKPGYFSPDPETQYITPLVPKFTSEERTDMFFELMQVIDGMSPEEVKAYLERRRPGDDAKGREAGKRKDGSLEYWAGW
jgi:hypothetical protein